MYTVALNQQQFVLFWGCAMQEVGREVIYTQGCFSRVRIWYAGWIPGIHGIFTHGWRGEEQTMVQKDIITAVGTFTVLEASNAQAA